MAIQLAVTNSGKQAEESSATAAATCESTRAASASLARGVLALLSTKPLTMGASLMVTILLPRLMGDQGFGQYSLATNVAILTTTLAFLGVPKSLTRRIAADPERAAVEGGAALIVVGGSALLLAFGLSVELPVIGLPLSEPGLLPITLGLAVVTAIQWTALAGLLGRERHGPYAWLNAAPQVAGPCIGLAILTIGGGVTGYMVGFTAVATLVALLAWRASGAGLRRSAINPKLWRLLICGGLPFLGFDVAITIRNQIDVILVGILLHEHVAGWLAAAYRIVTIPLFIPQMIGIPLLPVLTRAAGDWVVFRATLRRVIPLTLTLTIASSAITIAAAPAIPQLLGWGPEFQNSVPLMMILALELPLAALNTVCGPALVALHRERPWLRVAVVAAAFNPIMNVLLLPLFADWSGNGAVGAAVVEVATEILILSGMLMLLPRGIFDRSLGWVIARLVLAGLATIGTTSVLLPIGLPLAVGGGGVVFIGLVLLLRVFGLAEAQATREILVESLGRRFRPTEPSGVYAGGA